MRWDSNKEEMVDLKKKKKPIQLWNGVFLLRPSQQAALSRPLIAAFSVGCINQHAERTDPPADCICTLKALQKVRVGAFHRED